MGLDIYVGSFTRYFGGDWETIVAKAAREQGMAFHVIRTNPDPPDKITNPAAIRPIVEQWRSGLEQGLRPHLPDGLSWNEEPNSDYFSDKPDWIGYSGLILLGAHTALPKYPPPARATAHFDRNPAFQELGANDFRCPFSQIFEVETWLPCAFSFTFESLDIVGNQ